MREESDCQKSLIAQMAAASSEAETMTAEKLQVCLGGGQVCLGGGIAGVSQRRDCRCVSEEGAKERREGGEERERERERGRERHFHSPLITFCWLPATDWAAISIVGKMSRVPSWLLHISAVQ